MHDGDQFYSISQQAQTIKQTLKTSGCLNAIAESIQSCPIDLRSTTVDEGAKNDKAANKKACLLPYPVAQAKLLDGVIHAAYFLPLSHQYFSSSVSEAYRSRGHIKMLFRNYGRCRLLLRNARLPSEICIATDHECFYVWLTTEFHMYLAVPRGISTGVIGQFYRWVKKQEKHLFLENIECW